MKWPKEFVAARILLCVLELIVGILLWIDPAGFATGIFVVGGVLLMLLGVVQIVQYFRLSPEEAFFRQPLVKGLLLIGIGALFVFCHKKFLLENGHKLTSPPRKRYNRKCSGCARTPLIWVSRSCPSACCSRWAGFLFLFFVVY